ncbi:MAG TPA: TetR/AcrR family transcriptional regulator C-terminal domain-containing protein [Caulobacteraceae bacterium]|jgi:AcrR family transcriptional regulator|nr:TetR/AcrR family transcriptional regulator C-terminal domain-containing protein [Caulobacteraceae bacterium]
MEEKSRAPDLAADRIAAAALRVVDTEGVRGFTMRAVAEALGVTPMAIYHHVADKAALAALVIDAAAREIPFPNPTGDWREDLLAMARWSRQTTLSHPGVGRLRSAHGVWTPAILQMTERWVGLWQQSGLPLDAAVRAANVSSAAIVGLVGYEIAVREMATPEAAMLVHLPNARLAFTAKHDPAEAFELAVHALIDGLRGG